MILDVNLKFDVMVKLVDVNPFQPVTLLRTTVLDATSGMIKVMGLDQLEPGKYLCEMGVPGHMSNFVLNVREKDDG